MRFHVVLAVLLIFAGFAVAQGYDYPYRDPYLATATIAILGYDDKTTQGDGSEILRVPGLPGRNRLPTLEGQGEVSLSFYRQNKPAPLLFITGGVGSNPYFGLGPYFASLFHKAGFNVAVLPSPMHWNFALAASRSGVPGYPPDDARDLYNVMQKTMTVLKNRGVKPTTINYLGISLGALDGAYVSIIDRGERKIGIAKYLLIQPPIELGYALKKVEEWSRLATKFGPHISQEVVSRAYAIALSFLDDKPDNPAVVDRFAQQFSEFSTPELQFLIAQAMQNQLSELIYVTQVIHDQKILSAPKGDKRKRLEEAKNLTLVDYNWKVAMPIWRKQLGDPDMDAETLMRRSSLARIVDQLRENPRVHIVLNADDMLVEKSSVVELKETLGDQATLYPYGGHLGNLWYPENRQMIMKYFTPASQRRPELAISPSRQP